MCRPRLWPTGWRCRRSRTLELPRRESNRRCGYYAFFEIFPDDVDLAFFVTSMHTLSLFYDSLITVVPEHPASQCSVEAAKFIRRAIVSHNLVVEYFNAKFVDDSLA